MASPGGVYPTRRAAHAGSWYSDDGPALARQLDAWLAECRPLDVNDDRRDFGPLPPPPPPPAGATVRGIIGPHAGYRYSGRTAAAAYAALEDALVAAADAGAPVMRVVLLGPSHRVHLAGCAVSGAAVLETPVGALAVDRTTAASLVASRSPSFRWTTPREDEEEHSLEMHLPVLARVVARAAARVAAAGKVAPPPPPPPSRPDELLPGCGGGGRALHVLPIMVGALTPATEAAFGAALAPLLVGDPATLVVVSSDFCHYGRRFSYTPAALTQAPAARQGLPQLPLWRAIADMDRRGMDAIAAVDHASWGAYIAATRNTVCGRHAIGVLLAAVQHAAGGGSGVGRAAAPASASTSSSTSAAAAAATNITFIAYDQSSRCLDAAADSSVSYAAAVVWQL